MLAKNTKSVKVEPLFLESYIQTARGSVGAKLFQKFYCKLKGKKTEVLQGGNLSCAYHISSILKIFSLIKNVQLTVHRVLDEMFSSGWYKINKPRLGSVIVWQEKPSNPGRMRRQGKIYAARVKHLGIFVGGGKAVHNSDVKKVPVLNNWEYRPVEMILWNNKLK